MNFHFENRYTDDRTSYQKDAIESVCDLFRGQEICRTEFTVSKTFGSGQLGLAGMENDLGNGNRLRLLDDEILVLLNDIQLRNGTGHSSGFSVGSKKKEVDRLRTLKG